MPSYEAWYDSTCEAIHSMDENLGRVNRYLKEHELGVDLLEWVELWLQGSGPANGEG